jgi:hypothetical protein
MQETLEIKIREIIFRNSNEVEYQAPKLSKEDMVGMSMEEILIMSQDIERASNARVINGLDMDNLIEELGQLIK